MRDKQSNNKAKMIFDENPCKDLRTIYKLL